MAYGKSRYNAYRKRSFNRSDTQRREYAQAMEELSQAFDELSQYGWFISSHLDSAYKNYDYYQVRLSNHSADNQYHDTHEGYLIVNVKASKQDFVWLIKNYLDHLLSYLDTLDLSKYRFINVTNRGKKITCYYRGFKTKKDVIDKTYGFDFRDYNEE